MKVFFYGSLKRDGYNFNRFGGQKFLFDFVLPNYVMFNLGPYPTIAKSDGNEFVVGEIHELEPNAFTQILLMEVEAGYQLDVFHNGGEEIFVFTMSHLKNKLDKKFPRINNGFWRVVFDNE